LDKIGSEIEQQEAGLRYQALTKSQAQIRGLPGHGKMIPKNGGQSTA
jgi:hypothetical protein